MKPLIGTANLLAGQAVALAESFLADRTSAAEVSHKTIFLLADLRRLRAMQVDLPTSSIVDATFILAIALRNSAANHDRSCDADTAAMAARGARWRELLAAFIEHVRRESLSLKEEGHFA